jgi:pimeloyl-ACP methyl ester carboxylesterase
MPIRRRAMLSLCSAVAVLGLTQACDSEPTSRAPRTEAPSSTVRTPPTGEGPSWSGLAACEQPDLTSYRCGTLTVPLDRGAGGSGDRLELPVLVAGSRSAERTLLVLTGGPGQPGLALAARVLPRLDSVAGDYRLVMLDQRGTGATALECPDLQAQVGQSDFEVPTAGAVAACASLLGDARSAYSTTATVLDLDALRQALGVDAWSIDGTSYGTYVAQRYAGAYPEHTDKLVLDSVVPVDGFDPTMVDTFPEVARVLRTVCRSQGCPSDPATDLASVVRQAPDLGPRLLDIVTLMSVAQPTFAGLPDALRAAAGGDEAPLQELLAGWEEGSGGPAEELSQGLHASTLCLDLDFPWGGADSPPGLRKARVDRTVASLTERQLRPFDATTARGNGIMSTCQLWPVTADPAVPASQLSLRDAHALLLHGELDLSTPAAWTTRAHADIPDSQVLTIRGVGHSTQGQSPQARAAVARFLLAR